jgi:hypothetical protein
MAVCRRLCVLRAVHCTNRCRPPWPPPAAFFKVRYQDGDVEELELFQLRKILAAPDPAPSLVLRRRLPAPAPKKAGGKKRRAAPQKDDEDEAWHPGCESGKRQKVPFRVTADTKCYVDDIDDEESDGYGGALSCELLTYHLYKNCEQLDQFGYLGAAEVRGSELHGRQCCEECAGRKSRGSKDTNESLGSVMSRRKRELLDGYEDSKYAGGRGQWAEWHGWH